jgi:eukaryotic-like serine/threonine-protein kinase
VIKNLLWRTQNTEPSTLAAGVDSPSNLKSSLSKQIVLPEVPPKIPTISSDDSPVNRTTDLYQVASDMTFQYEDEIGDEEAALADDADAPSEHDQKLAVLMSQLTDRMHHGEDLSLETICFQYPEFALDLRLLWGTMVVAQVAGRVDSEEAARSSSSPDSGVWQLQLPVSLGDYELLEELGHGGMGVVYRARQTNLGRDVAVKMILRGQLATAQDRRRFFVEAEATAKLNHPNIVPVYEVGEIEGRPYFSMQLIRGETLAARITDGPLSNREAARIMIPICRAVNYAHEQGILHRDIKPSNILIDESGRPRLTDFGLAKQSGVHESLTRTGAVLGTPTYMSPEQANGRVDAVGPRSDVYSIGTVLYHILTGRPPLVANSPVELALKILEQDPPAPRLLEPKIDRDLEMIVVRCLQKPPDLRYESAAALANDLEAFMRDEPIAARSGQFAQIVARVFRETHHAPVLENWGLLWMWHSLVLLIACFVTEAFEWSGIASRLAYAGLWTVGLGTWAAVFWAIRRRMGPVTFVERQIAHVWGASMIAIAAMFPLEWLLGLDSLTLTPLLGVIAGMVFVIKAGILSGAFYFQAVCLFAAAIPMAIFKDYAHIIFGLVAAPCFFFPGLKYYRQKNAQQ